MQLSTVSILAAGLSLAAAHETAFSASATSTPCARTTKTVTQQITIVGCKPGLPGCLTASPTSSPFSSFSVHNATSHATPTAHAHAHTHTTLAHTGAPIVYPHATKTSGVVGAPTHTAKFTVPPGNSAAGLGSRPGLLLGLLGLGFAFLA